MKLLLWRFKVQCCSSSRRLRWTFRYVQVMMSEPLIRSPAHTDRKKLQDLKPCDWTNMQPLPHWRPIRASRTVLIAFRTKQLSIFLTFFHVFLWKPLIASKKKSKTQRAQKWSHYVEEHLSLVPSITVRERAVQIITFSLLYARLLRKLDPDFLCTVAAGCLETRRGGKEHCGSYLPIKGTTRTSAHFAFVSNRAFFNGTNCMILGSWTVGNSAPPCSPLKLWANYFHLQGNLSSLCLQTISNNISACFWRWTQPCLQTTTTSATSPA